MKKHMSALLAVLLAAAMLLSGCSAVKKAEKELEELNRQSSAVVVTYDGGEITAGELMGELNSLYNMYYSYLSMLGYEMTAEDVYSMMRTVMEEYTQMKVAAARFDAEHSLTDAEIAAAQEEAQARYDMLHEQALAGVEGGSEEEKLVRAQIVLKEAGYDFASLSANALMWKKVERMEEIIGAEVQELSEEELFAAYEEKVSEYEQAVAEGEASVEDDMASVGGIAYWMPEGYRRVRHILLIPGEEARLGFMDAEYALEKAQDALAALEEELADARDYDGEEPLERGEELIRGEIAAAEETITARKAGLAAARRTCLEEVKEKTDAIYARLAAGEDFGALIAEYGEDPGMQNEPTASRGYYVSAASENWEENFRDGAMSLTNPGDYSPEPVVGSSGVHIIRYEDDAAAGPADFEEVKNALYGETMEAARAEHCGEVFAQWVGELNPVYDLEAFSKVFTGE